MLQIIITIIDNVINFNRNGRLLPIPCLTYLESLCISGQFKLSGNHISASYEASEFCWQIGLNFLQHLRPCLIKINF